MVISCKQESPKCDIFINKVKLKQTEKFKYLGTIILNDGKTNREISARIAQAKINFQKMKTILTNKHISIETRKRALQCYIEPFLMYGCETWTISKQIQNKLEATEMWFLRRMLRIPWTAKKTNERVLNEANKRRSLVRTIRKRQATFLGHMIEKRKTGTFGNNRKKHANSSSLLCLYCLKVVNVRFISQGWAQTLNYYNHLVKHQVRNCTKKCPLCKLVFISASALKIHRQTEHLPNQKGVMAAHTRSTSAATDQVMIKVAGDTGSGGRNSKGGGGGGAGSGGSLDFGVRSLNVPAVKKVLEHKLTLLTCVSTEKCVECGTLMNKPDHYKKFIQCSMCRFASSCSYAYSNHMLGFHSGQAVPASMMRIPPDRPMEGKLYCECGFSSVYGNQIANHLVSCSKSSCYKDPPPAPSGDNFGKGHSG
ncbi:pogo transposable element with znf domain [Plakobranchus ocellatus]|uniref:Pogo transposable element with znf domain n=1 Tax=Plakobranchus ocellatus TaxID=259542 RepID=A0AAV4CKL8_9GAST|nr:pogo transposable element with znf domain [Plakobranchus ocellatus]